MSGQDQPAGLQGQELFPFEKLLSGCCVENCLLGSRVGPGGPEGGERGER